MLDAPTAAKPLTRRVVVTIDVDVTVDEAKFTDEFFAEFSASIFYADRIDELLEHLGQLHARGIADDQSFIEGFGPAKDMGISFKTPSIETELVRG